MIKKTVVIENPARLKIHNAQLIIEQEREETGRMPVEDIGVLILDHPAVLYTHGCLTQLLENNTAVVVCGKTHHPQGLLLPLDTNQTQSEQFRIQIEAAEPTKKQIWKQTVQAKILNQAALLKERDQEPGHLQALTKKVGSGDPTNTEAQASRYYWPRLLGKDFRRARAGPPPNNLLNYGYMVIRAAVARALVGSGLLPTLGIHHCNRYNAFCLADDVMEPFRPFVDRVAARLHDRQTLPDQLTKEIKQELLNVLVEDVRFQDQTRPLMVGLHQTTASLVRCLARKQKSVDYPRL